MGGDDWRWMSGGMVMMMCRCLFIKVVCFGVCFF